MTFARRLRNLRLAHGLSLRALAQRANISKARLTLVENHDGNPTLAFVANIARSFGLSLGELLAPVGTDVLADMPRGRRRGRAQRARPVPHLLAIADAMPDDDAPTPEVEAAQPEPEPEPRAFWLGQWDPVDAPDGEANGND